MGRPFPRSRTPLALAALLSLCACGGEKDAPATAEERRPATTEAPAKRAPKAERGPRGPIDAATVGAITGVVRFEGVAPERKTLSIGGTGGCPHHPEPPLSEEVVVSDGKLANAFVWIKDGYEGWDVPAQRDEPVVMDQKGCLYVPHVIGMRAGQKLLITNSDSETTHNVNIRSRSNDAMNPLQPPGGKPIEWKPTKKELGVSFECNLHPWMRAFVCVVDVPWFAVSAADGTFAIQDVPPGEYVLEAWHEKYGKRTAAVTLAAGGNAEAVLTFAP